MSPSTRRLTTLPTRRALVRRTTIVVAQALIACVCAAPALAADNDQEFSRASDAEARAVTERYFGRTLESLTDVEPDLHSGERIVRYPSDTTAIIADGEDRSVLQSALPLRAENEHGDKRPVSLDLVADGADHTAKSAIADVTLGDTLADGLRFSDIGVAVRPLGVDGQTEGVVSGQRLDYPNADASGDMDVTFTPTLMGAETFNVLRSADSPERLRYAVDLPFAAQLERDPATPGGLRVVRGDQVLLRIAPVDAHDADRKPIRGSYELTDGGFDIVVNHTDQDPEYPILVDPELTVDQMYFSDTGIYFKGWEFSTRDTASTLNSSYQTGPTSRGLHIWNDPGNFYAQYFWGKWSLRIGEGAYFQEAKVGKYALLDQADGTMTCTGAGIMNTAGTAWIPQNVNAMIRNNQWSQRLGQHLSDCSTGQGFASTEAQFLPTQQTMGGALTVQWYANSSAVRNKTHLLFLGGAWARVADDLPPSQPTITGAGDGTWTATAPTSLTVNTSDNGTGVRDITATRTAPGASTTLTTASDPNNTALNCDKTLAENKYQPYLWCPPTAQRKFNLGTVPEGESTYEIRASDIMGGTGNTATKSHTIRLDTTKPTIDTSSAGGTLWANRNQATDHRNEILTAATPDFTIPISAITDSGGSGVKDVEVRIKNSADAVVHSGAASRIGADWKWSNALTGFADGTYNIQIIARDNVAPTGSISGNNATLLEFSVEIDRQGDVQSAKETTGDLSGTGEMLAQEWVRPQSRWSRRRTADRIETRTDVPCAEGNPSGPQCPEYRDLLPDSQMDPAYQDLFSRTKGASPGDPNVPQPSSLLDPSNLSQRTPEAEGQVASVTPTWLTLPPGRGNTFRRYDFSGSDDGPSDTPDADGVYSGATAPQQTTLRVYVDAETKLPIKQEILGAAGTVSSTVYWTYTKRTSVSDHPSDYFRVAAPASAGLRTDTDYMTNDAQGTVRDNQTQAQFQPFTLGGLLQNVANLSIDGLCMTTQYLFKQDEPPIGGEIPADPVTDPDATTANLDKITRLTAQYVPITSGFSCVPGTNQTDASDIVEVSSFAKDSGYAKAFRDAIKPMAQAISVDANDGDHSLGGLLDFTRQAMQTTAYIVPTTDAAGTVAIADIGDTTVMIRGPLTKLDIPLLFANLEVL